MVVVTIAAPWPGRNIAHFHKLPVGHIGWAEPEVIAHSRGDIETCSVIQVRFRALILENILEMVGTEGSAIFPLGIANTIAFADRQPVVFANRAARFAIGTPKPRDNPRGLRLELSVRDIVVREGAIKRILPGRK